MRILKVIKLLLFVVFIGLVIAHFADNGGSAPKPHPIVDPVVPGSEMVLIEYETGPSPQYTKDQLTALQFARSGDGEAWMATNTKEHHVLDKDQDVSALDKTWRDAIDAAKSKPLPNISVWNGRRWTVKQKPIATTADVKSSIGMSP